MTANQENRLSMYKTFIAFCEKYPAIMAVNSKLMSYYLAFKAIVAEIELTGQQQDLEIKGIAADKNDRKRLLAESCVKVASYIIPYAIDQNNHQLEQQVDYNAGELVRLRDEIIILRARNIFNIADTLMADLAPYEFNTLILSDLDNCILLYGQKSEQPTVARSFRAAMTEKLKGLYINANKLLRRQTGKLIETLKKDYPDFHEEFTQATKIIDLGGRKRKLTENADALGFLMSNITDKDTGEPIEGATLKMKSKTSELILVEASDEEGDVYVESIPTDKYDVIVEIPGYMTQTVTDVQVNMNDELTMDFVMEAELPIV